MALGVQVKMFDAVVSILWLSALWSNEETIHRRMFGFRSLYLTSGEDTYQSKEDVTVGGHSSAAFQAVRQGCRLHLSWLVVLKTSLPSLWYPLTTLCSMNSYPCMTIKPTSRNKAYYADFAQR